MTKFKIYQINAEKDTNNVSFMSYDRTIKKANKIDSSIYDLVETYEAGDNVSFRDLEDVFTVFQHCAGICPRGFAGRSLSVSDVVEVLSLGNEAPGYYFCDNIGFREIDFEPKEAGKLDTMQVVICDPTRKAYSTSIGKELCDLQEVVEGYIEICYPFPHRPHCCIVCNDSGKINDMQPCRATYGLDGEITDIIFGPFFICDGSAEDLKDLNMKDTKYMLKTFEYGEEVTYEHGKIAMKKIGFGAEKED